MPTSSRTEQTEQRVLNAAKDSLYDTIAVTPWVETTVGSVAQRITGTVIGTKIAADVNTAANKLDTAPRIGQTKIAVTGTAVQLGANTLLNGVIVTAKSTNTAAITVGGAAVTNTVDGTGNGYILEAGASTSAAVDNTNCLYINGTAGDICSWAGS